MKNIEPYLIFDGNCEKAFTFYESVFGVKIAAIMKYKDMPAEAKKNISESDMERVIHVLLPVSNKVSLMGSDSPGNMKTHAGDNVSLTLNVENEAEAQRIFEKLSEGGKVTMPLGRTFFADLYAMFTDKFGIHWMIIYAKEESPVILTVDKNTHTIHIVCKFAAPTQSVWDAWTKQDMLEKWWAPKPYHVETRSFELTKGGMWLYAMVGPDNEKHWGKADFKKIDPLKQIIWQDAFSDENGHIDPKMPRSLWTIDFAESKGITTVNITLQTNGPAELEALITMGFKEGITMTLNYLEELLK